MNLNNHAKLIIENVCEMSAKSAADSLSTMINIPVHIQFPDISTETLKEFGRLSKDTVLSMCKIEGDLKGGIIMAFTKETILPLIDLIMLQKLGTQQEINEEVKIAYNELTNVIGGSYLSTLANHLSYRLFPKPPLLITDYKSIEQLPDGIKKNISNIISIRTILTVEKSSIEGTFLFILDDDSIDLLIQRLEE